MPIPINPESIFHELKCKDCKSLLGFIKQKYYTKHEYLCMRCYFKYATSNGDKVIV